MRLPLWLAVAVVIAINAMASLGHDTLLFVVISSEISLLQVYCSKCLISCCMARLSSRLHV